MTDLRRGKPRRIRQRVGMVNMRRAADHAVYVAARISDWERQVRADERERIAQAIEAQPIDAWGSQAPRGPVTFARREAVLRSAAIARGEVTT